MYNRCGPFTNLQLFSMPLASSDVSVRLLQVLMEEDELYRMEGYFGLIRM